MKTYLVGGAVRDIVMGVKPKDNDYVVVGSTPEEMVALGFKKVGADFPVFLHPETNEEYALARTERKTGIGYHGFTTDFSKEVTLAEDLLRRDLTINSIAMDVNTREVFDPYGGIDDIHRSILRATSTAFREDPVRILRVARFAARLPFDVDRDTMNIMKGMVKNGEFGSLTPERVYAEFKKGLMERQSHRMFRVLDDCGALEKLPFWNRVAGNFVGLFDHHTPIEHRIAVMAKSVSKQSFLDNRVPNEAIDLAVIADEFEYFIECVYNNASPDDYMNLFSKVDIYRQLKRSYIALNRILYFRRVHVPTKLFTNISNAYMVNAGIIAAKCDRNSDIKEAVYNARRATII